MRFEGVFVALVTPFTDSGSIDFPAFEQHLSSLKECGIQGFVPCGTTGESPTLSSEERTDLIRNSVATGLKTIAGCGSNNTKHSLSMIEEAAKLGAEAALVVTPYYNKPTQSGLLAHYRYLADRSPLPIILYNVPGRTSVNLNPETVAELWQHPMIAGIKEASGNHGQWLALSRSLDTENKSLMAGDDDAFATILGLGGSGIISASANIAPKHFVDIWNLAKSGNWTSAFTLQAKLVPLIRALFMETNPAPIKFALKTMLKMRNELRLPLVPVQPSTEKAILDAIRSLE